MRRGSLVAPLILIVIGVLFLLNNMRPDLSMVGMLGRFWPFLLIGWGGLRLIEILVWASRNRPLPVSGVSGGEWTLIVFLSIFGSGMFWATNRSQQWPLNVRLRGIELLGEAWDYPLADQKVSLAGSKAPRVVIESLRGNARVTGSDSTEVRLTGRTTVRALDKEDADRAAANLKFVAVREGDTIFIRSQQPRIVSDDHSITTDLEIAIPRGARVEAHGRRGDFDITDVSGDIDIDSDNAGVRLQNIGGNVRIELRASDIVRALGVKGTVEIKGTGQDVELENIDGQVTVNGNYFGDLQFRAISKPVRFEGGSKSRTSEVRVEACPGQIRIRRGDLTMENVTGPVLVNAKSKDVQISDFTQSLDLRVERGDIDIRPGVNPVPRMTVTTNAGNVDLTLPENGRFSMKAVAEKGEVENDFGDALKSAEEGRGATLTGSAGTAGGSEISVRTSRGAVRVRKGGSTEAVRPLPPAAPRPPLKAIPPSAAQGLVIERN